MYRTCCFDFYCLKISPERFYLVKVFHVFEIQSSFQQVPKTECNWSFISDTQHVQRHPFARLFSAWNQKFKRNNDRWRDFIDAKIEYFEEFKNRSTSTHLNTFEAFLKHIAATKRSKDFNVHWSRIYRSCRPCSIDYRVFKSNVFEMIDFIERLFTKLFVKNGLVEQKLFLMMS